MLGAIKSTETWSFGFRELRVLEKQVDSIHIFFTFKIKTKANFRILLRVSTHLVSWLKIAILLLYPPKLLSPAPTSLNYRPVDSTVYMPSPSGYSRRPSQH